jgi:quinol monooxygenase YgiN
MEKPGLVIAATFEMAPEDREKTIELSRRVVQETRKEKGCLFYAFANDILDPNIFRISEGWTDEAALNAHLATPHVTAYLEDMGKLKMLSMTATRYNVASMSDLLAPQD